MAAAHGHHDEIPEITVAAKRPTAARWGLSVGVELGDQGVDAACDLVTRDAAASTG
jgi:hypothetical protein